MIHMAVPDDLPAIFALVDTYCEDMDIDRVITKNSLREMLYVKGVLLVEYNGDLIGGIAGYTLPGMFNRDLFFSVMFFYIIKDYRFLTKSIIKELELVLLTTPVTKICFGVLGSNTAKKMQRFYRMMGYSELETHMVKDIKYAN